MCTYVPIAWSSWSIDSVSITTLGVLTSIPYMFEFLAYTFLVANWAAVYHFAMASRGSSPFAKLRIPFIITNIIFIATILVLFVGLTSSASDVDTAKKYSQAGTIIVSASSLTHVVYVNE
jgi:hypothetical protein